MYIDCTLDVYTWTPIHASSYLNQGFQGFKIIRDHSKNFQEFEVQSFIALNPKIHHFMRCVDFSLIFKS